MERESIRKLFPCTRQPAPLFIALHVILAPHSLDHNKKSQLNHKELNIEGEAFMIGIPVMEPISSM